MSISFTKLAAEVWRKYLTAGVPASGLHSPDLDEVEQWGTDVETALLGGTVQRTHIAATAVTIGTDTDAGVVLINKTVAAATTVNLPASSTRVSPVTIVDRKYDAATNNITIVPNGIETIMGGASYIIDSNGGSITLHPLADNTGWF